MVDSRKLELHSHTQTVAVVDSRKVELPSHTQTVAVVDSRKLDSPDVNRSTHSNDGLGLMTDMSERAVPKP